MLKSILWLPVIAISLVEATLPVCKTCPVNGQWSPWSDHTTCSKTCGLFGQKVQKRSCPSFAMGCPCKGPVSRIVPCASAVCPKAPVCATGYKKYQPRGSTRYVCGNITRDDNYRAPGCRITKKMHPCPCPTGGAWSAWQNSAPCQKFDYNFTKITCGMFGTVWQTRTCKSTAQGCPCSGPDRRKISCPKNPCTTGQKCYNNLPIVKNLNTGAKECGLNVWAAPIMNPLPPCYTTTTTTTTVTTFAPCGSGCSEADLQALWLTDDQPQKLSFTYSTDANGCLTAGYVCQAINASDLIFFGVRPQEPPYPDYYPNTGYYTVERQAIGSNIVSKVPNPFLCAMTSPTPRWQFDSYYFNQVDILTIFCQLERPMGAE
ncbi:unnamed protein product, partial [Mesorhabditis belari]|uniref:Uncharacterized protein n=1 Tax=Mesorhabditis belari TaxID=2138241 RepID=A0AAF3FNB3_9BILA